MVTEPENKRTVGESEPSEFIKELATAMAPLLLQLGNGIIGSVRSLPQLAQQATAQLSGSPMIGSLVGGWAQSALSKSLDYVTGTGGDRYLGIRTSDLMFGTTNSAINAMMARRFADDIGYPVLRDKIADSMGVLSAQRLGIAIGDRTSDHPIISKMTAAMTKDLLDAVLPGISTADRVTGIRSNPSEVATTMASIAQRYVTGAFGSAREADISSIVGDLRTFGGSSGRGEALVTAVKETTKSLDNIRDFLGSNISASQMKQIFTEIAGTDLTRTGRGFGQELSAEMSYLNRRYGLDYDTMKGAAVASRQYLGQFGVSDPLAGAMGVQLAGYIASHKSTNMFVSDQQLAASASQDANALILNGTADEAGLAVAAAKSLNINVDNDAVFKIAATDPRALAKYLADQSKGRISEGQIVARMRNMRGTQLHYEATASLADETTAYAETLRRENYDKAVAAIGLSGEEAEAFKGMSASEQETFLMHRFGSGWRSKYDQLHRATSYDATEYEKYRTSRNAKQIYAAKQEDLRRADLVKRYSSGIQGAIQYINDSTNKLDKEQQKVLVDTINKFGDTKTREEYEKLFKDAGLNLGSPQIKDILSVMFTGRTVSGAAESTDDGKRSLEQRKAMEALTNALKALQTAIETQNKAKPDHK